MKRSFYLLLAGALSLTLGASAGECCGGCYLPCGRFEVGGEMLYMQPTVCDLPVTIVDHRPYVPPPAVVVIGALPNNTEENPPIGTIQKFNPHYRFGFRASVGYVWQDECRDCCFDMTGEDTWFHTCSSLTVRPNPGGRESGGLWVGDFTDTNPFRLPAGSEPIFTQQILFNATDNPIAFPGERDAFVKAWAKFWYDAGDIQVGSRMSCCGLALRGFIGVHFANLQFAFSKHVEGTLHPGIRSSDAFPNLFSQGVIGDVHQHAHSWVVGPKLGVAAKFDLLCGFGIGGRFGAAILAGRRHSKYCWNYRQFSGLAPAGGLLADFILDTPSVRQTVISPEFDARLGLNYTWCCSDCFTLFVEAGYEIITYLNLLDKGPMFRQDRGLLGDECQPFSLNGVYLSLNVMF